MNIPIFVAILLLSGPAQGLYHYQELQEVSHREELQPAGQRLHQTYAATRNYQTPKSHGSHVTAAVRSVSHSAYSQHSEHPAPHFHGKRSQFRESTGNAYGHSYRQSFSTGGGYSEAYTSDGRGPSFSGAYSQPRVAHRNQHGRSRYQEDQHLQRSVNNLQHSLGSSRPPGIFGRQLRHKSNVRRPHYGHEAGTGAFRPDVSVGPTVNFDELIRKSHGPEGFHRGTALHEASYGVASVHHGHGPHVRSHGPGFGSPFASTDFHSKIVENVKDTIHNLLQGL